MTTIDGLSRTKRKGRARCVAAILATMVPFSTLSTPDARADGGTTRPPMTLEAAVKTFRSRGYDLLIADAQTRATEGDLRAAGAVSNPILSPFIGRVLHYDPTGTPASPCDGCSPYTVGVSITDPSALSDLLTGKRSLRQEVASRALEMVKAGRRDVERQLIAQVKTQVVLVAGARSALDFAKDVQASLEQTVKLDQARYPNAIDEGQLARVQREKLEADNTVDLTDQRLRAAQVSLGYLLGDRSGETTYDVDPRVLDYEVPSSLQTADEPSLLARAYGARPDLQQATVGIARAESSFDLARRQRIPDVGWTLSYAQTGTGQNAIQPPTVTLGVSLPLPIFYQRQGEIERAEAERQGAQWQREKVAAEVRADVQTAWTAFVATRRIVERTQSSLLERSRKAKDITEVQFHAGSTSLMDFLDAERAFVQTNVAYRGALVAYWTSIFQLEAAVGSELT